MELGDAARIVDYYRENGPGTAYRELTVDAFDQFRLDGYLVMLIGQQVPHASTYRPKPAEWETWKKSQIELDSLAQQGMSVEEALKIIRMPEWSWRPDFYSLASG